MFFKGKKKDKEKEKSHGNIGNVISVENKTGSQSNLHVEQNLSNEDLKIQFSQLLYELGVPEAKRVEMELWSNDKKWMLLVQNKDKIKENEEKMKQKGSLYETPQFYLSLLRENASIQKTISDLKVSLASNKLSWIDSFIGLSGFDEILKIFQTFQLKPEKNSIDFLILFDCVNIIKSILNSQSGVKSVMTTSHTFKVLVLCLDQSYPPELRNAVLQLTAALTLLPTVGHSYVLEAIENFKVSNREKVRFQTIIEGAKSVSNTQLHYEYLTSFMNLVNSIVNSPADLQVRIGLRSEFTALKLIELISNSKGVSEDLDTQINLFFECMEEDNDEVGAHYKEVNIRSPSEVSTKIDTLLQSHPALHHHFISIIKGLYTLASTQSDLGGSMWNILDESVGLILKDPSKESQLEKLQNENNNLKLQLSEIKLNNSNNNNNNNNSNNKNNKGKVCFLNKEIEISLAQEPNDEQNKTKKELEEVKEEEEEEEEEISTIESEKNKDIMMDFYHNTLSKFSEFKIYDQDEPELLEFENNNENNNNNDQDYHYHSFINGRVNRQSNNDLDRFNTQTFNRYNRSINPMALLLEKQGGDDPEDSSDSDSDSDSNSNSDSSDLGNITVRKWKPVEITNSTTTDESNVIKVFKNNKNINQ